MHPLPDSATDLALKAFDFRPNRPEALADLCRHFRERGMNETAAMLARRGLAISSSDDLLFVEILAREEFRTTLAISGYYSKDEETRRLAGEAAESLSLDRNASRPAVEHARNVLFWHAPKLATIATSWESRRLEFDAPKGWRTMNPSVVRYRDKTLAIVRCVNYWIEPDGSYTFPDGEPAISTRNFLCELGPLHVTRDPVEVAPDLGPVQYGGVLGLEDIRLFVWRGDLRFVAACRQMNSQGRVEQVTGYLDRDGTVRDMMPVRHPWTQYAEKNWQPIQGAEDCFVEPHFVYRTDPTTIVCAAVPNVPPSRPAPWAADNWSGSTPLIPFDDGWLALVHEPLSSPINGRRLNQQRFVWWNENLRPARHSRRWIFKLNEEIEYVVGLARAPTGDDLIISYGSHDRQAWVGTLAANDVRTMLGMQPQDWFWSKLDNPIQPRILKYPTGDQPPYRPPGESDHYHFDRLALDRDARAEVRAKARRQLHAYLKPIGDVFPSWRAQKLDITPPDGFAAMAPSLVLQHSRWAASVRCINYRPAPLGGYERIRDGVPMGIDVIPESRTLLVEIDAKTLAVDTSFELASPWELGPPSSAVSIGFEDMRLFEWEGALWGVAAFTEQSHDQLPEQWLVRVGTDWRLRDARPIYLKDLPRRAEKNWMPIVERSGELRFLYLCDPTTVLDRDGATVVTHESPFAAEHFRGGSQLVPFDGGWLAVVHWLQVMDDADPWVSFEYRNRFVWFDAECRLQKLSSGWTFPMDMSVGPMPRNFQLVDGLAWHPDGKRLAMGFELYEREPWIGLLDADDVCRSLKS